MGVALQARLNHLQCGSVLVSGEEHTEGDLHCGWFVQGGGGGGGGGGGNMSSALYCHQHTQAAKNRSLI